MKVRALAFPKFYVHPMTSFVDRIHSLNSINEQQLTVKKTPAEIL
jgi:hypothetical protein